MTDRASGKLLIALGLILFATMASAQQYLNVRLPGQVAPSVVSAIAEIGQTQTLHVSAGASLATIIAQRCDGVDPLYLKLFLAANNDLQESDLTKLRDDRAVQFPACTRSPAKNKITVELDDLLGNIAKNVGFSVDQGAFKRVSREIRSRPEVAAEMGRLVAGTYSVSTSASYVKNVEQKIANTRMTVLQSPVNDEQGLRALSRVYYQSSNALLLAAANPHVDPSKKVRAGTEVIIPSIDPVWTSVQIKAEISPEEALSKVRFALTKAGFNPDDNLEAGPPASLIASVEGASECEGGSDNGRWPYNSQDFIDTLARTKSNIGAQHINARDTTILILDTGFDFANGTYQQFPQPVLTWLKGLAPRSGAPKGATIGTVPGLNLATSLNDPKSVSGYVDRWHGASVAGVALGSRQLYGLRRLAQLPVRVAFANVVRPDAQQKFIVDSKRAISSI